MNYRLAAVSLEADDASVRNARWLAAQCRAENEEVIPMAADVAQALADAAGLNVDTGGMTAGALAELIDHLADRVEAETETGRHQ